MGRDTDIECPVADQYTATDVGDRFVRSVGWYRVLRLYLNGRNGMNRIRCLAKKWLERRHQSII